MEDVRKTAVYIDGYNLYYGCLRGTAFKWLDTVSLFERLLSSQDPQARLDLVHYFTAPALGRFATHGEASVLAQQDYLRALQISHPQRLKVTLGSHDMDRRGNWLPEYVEGAAYDRNRRIRVWKLEEKQTDVNLALAMYRDAMSGQFDQLVVCTNDSDVAPALAAIRADAPGVRLGVVTPRRAGSRKAGARLASAALSRHADWTRRYLLDEELAAAQLPMRVPTRKQAIGRPAHW